MTRSTLIGSDHPALFLIKKGRSTDATGCFLSKKELFSCEYWEISKNTYFEEHLCMAASEVIVRDFLCGESLSKPSCFSNITKILVAFKPEPS